MHVKATHRGFHVKLREPGDTFDIPDDQFSMKWMERVEDATEPAETPAPVDAPSVTEAAPAAPVVKKRRGRPPKADSE